MLATVTGTITNEFIEVARGEPDAAKAAGIFARMNRINTQAGRGLFSVTFDTTLYVGPGVVRAQWADGLGVISAAGVPLQLEEAAAALHGQHVECTFRVPEKEGEHALVDDLRLAQ